MSRIGNAPIELSSDVQVDIKENSIQLKGPLGTLDSPVFDGISCKQEADKLVVHCLNTKDKKYRALHGTARSLLYNNFIGVTKGWSKKLQLVGVGYRAQLKGDVLVLALGYSHDLNYKLPQGVKATVKSNVNIELKSIDKQKVGQAAAQIRSLRPPEPYKGKGVLYEGEKIRRKATKSTK